MSTPDRSNRGVSPDSDGQSASGSSTSSYNPQNPPMDPDACIDSENNLARAQTAADAADLRFKTYDEGRGLGKVFSFDADYANLGNDKLAKDNKLAQAKGAVDDDCATSPLAPFVVYKPKDKSKVDKTLPK